MQNKDTASSPRLSCYYAAMSAMAGWISSSSSEVSNDDTPSIVAESTSPPAREDEGDAAPADPVVIHARAYQLEMFEESMKQNVIVVVSLLCHDGSSTG